MVPAGRASAAIQAVRQWGEMIKFSHSVFALPFALMATFLAARETPSRYPTMGQLALVVACMVTARSVAMTFNRVVDAAYDARNPRTAGRAIPAGRVSTARASLYLGVAAAAFVASCAGFGWLDGNTLPLLLSVPVLAYLCFYSYTKRFTRWSHFVLGSAIAFSPVAAWLAIDPNSVGGPVLLLMAAVTLWIAGFDIIYACQDVDFDRAVGLLSLPARLGVGPALWVARAAHAATVLLLVLLARTTDLGWLYGLGVAAVAGLLLVEHAIVRADDLSRVNLAFFTVNGIVSVLLGVLTIADCLIA